MKQKALNWILRSSAHGAPVLLTAVLFGWIATHQVDQFEQQRTEQDLRVNARRIAQWARTFRADELRELPYQAVAMTPPDSRITLLDDRGTVLADSVGEPIAMDNHAMRPEIIAARKGVDTTFVHYSHTTGDAMLYFARKVDSDASPIAFVRVAFPLQHVMTIQQSLKLSIWGSTAIAASGVLLLYCLLNTLLARRANTPLTITLADTYWNKPCMNPSENRDPQSESLWTNRRTANEAPHAPSTRDGQPKLEPADVNHFLISYDEMARRSLAVIRACAETLLAGAASTGRYRYYFLSHIIRESDRLHHLVRDAVLLIQVRTVTRLDSANVALEPIVNDCLSLFLEKARIRRISLVVLPVSRHHAEQCVVIRANRQWLCMILDNLVDNAINCTPVGGLVEVRVYEREGAAGIELQHSGPPILPSDLQRVFEPFVFSQSSRAHSSYNPSLGLAIVKELAEAMGGTVQAESLPRGGATFVVRLPTSAI